MKKALFKTLLAGLVMVLGLAACSGNKEETHSEPAETKAAPAEVPAAAETAPAASETPAASAE